MSGRRAKARRKANPPSYITKASALADLAGVKPGEVRVLNVMHDAWCGIFGGRSCNCEPDVELVPGKGEVS